MANLFFCLWVLGLCTMITIGNGALELLKKNGVIVGAIGVIPKPQVNILGQCFSFKGNGKDE